MSSRRIVVVGGSAGALGPLIALNKELPRGFPAPILVVQHIGAHPSILPNLLSRQGSLPAKHAEEGEVMQAGRIYVAPPDQHLLVDGRVMRLSRGPKEHHARPAIDPLFLSAALTHGSDVIGLVLSGWGDDGTAGLEAVKECGGRALVQRPEDAEQESMPLSALKYVAVDACVRTDELAAALVRMVAEPPPPRRPAMPGHLVREMDLILSKGDPMENLRAIGKPSSFVCPDCKGGLWELNDRDPERYRCHTGHAYTLRSLASAQGEATDGALWGALRALQERQALVERLATVHRGQDSLQLTKLQDEARELGRRADVLRQFIEEGYGADAQEA